MEASRFFSLNKKSDWEKGWAVNLEITDTGLAFGSDSEGEKSGSGQKDFSLITRGIYFSCSVDSAVKGTEWHKLVLEAEMPEDTEIKISYYASDESRFFLRDMSGGEGVYRNIDEYIADDSLDVAEKLNCLNQLWAGWLDPDGSLPMINPSDALFFKAKGRYLWVRIEVSGNKKKHTVLRKLRLYYPRTSYLEYLPAVYQDEPTSKDFLERFLSIFGTILFEMEEKIDHVAQFFDIDCISGEYLKWLAGWMAIASDDCWEEEQLRKFMKSAPEIYKRRGTKAAIEEMVYLYTGSKPFIIEYFQLKHLKDEPVYKELLPQLYDMDHYTFCVLVEASAVPTVQKRMALQKILDEEKPAFTEAKLILLKPWIYLNMHTYLGVNTYLSGFTSMKLDPEKSVLYNNILVDETERDEK